MAGDTVIRQVTPDITTFTCKFNRFAPFGYRKFVAVGNRSTAIRLASGQILLLSPIQLEPCILERLTALGGVHFVACDLGHHMYVKDYVDQWPDAKTIGVPGLAGKRRDVEWDFVYGAEGARIRPETVFGFEDDVTSVLFEGFITYCVAWYHKPSKTLMQSDLLMNLPCTEQYDPSSANAGFFSSEFAKRAHPWSIWFRRLIYYVASIDHGLMRRDVKLVAELDMARIIPCHGDVLEGRCGEAWRSVYEWFMDGRKPGLLWRFKTPFMRVMRRLFLE